MNMDVPEKWKELSAWILGGFCVLAFSLLVTFPYGTLHARLIAELHRVTGMDVRVADWTVGFPPGLEWRNITLSKPDWVPIQLGFLQAKVGLLKALSGSLGLDVVLRLDETSTGAGSAKGTITASSYALTGPVALKGQFQQVDLSRVLRRYVSRGILNGDFSHRLDSMPASVGTLKGEGNWKAEIRDLAVNQIPLGNGRTISLVFTRVSAGLACRDTTCDVTELKGDGIDGSFTGEGSISVQQPIYSSRLNLTVTVVPGVGFTAKAGSSGLPPLPPGTPMTVKVVGTLAQARIAL